MALQPKITYDFTSKGGDTITVHDSTGVYNATTNPTGLGFPNESQGDIEKILFTISDMEVGKVYRQMYVRVFDPNKPYEYTTPTINQIVAGVDIKFTSRSLQITGNTEPLKPFCDGVYDINMYYIMNSDATATGEEGEPFLIGTGLTTYYDYDAVYIGDVLYDIDKSKNDNGGTVLYLIQPLQQDATTFQPVRRANTKAFVSQSTLGNLSFNILADCGCKKGGEVYKYAYAIGNYINAEDAFNQGDYSGASRFLYAADKTLNCC